MCQELYIVQQEKSIESVQELQDAFGRCISDYVDNPADVCMDCCLCQVDTERYLTDCGALWERLDNYTGADINVLAMPPTTN